MNNLIASLYEFFFNYDRYQELLDAVWENYDYGKFGWVLLLVPLLFMLIFYKVWEPIGKQLLKWVLTMVVVALVVYASTTSILYYNPDVLSYIGNYTGDVLQVNGGYFIFQMSLISSFYSIILSFIYSLIIKKFSINNTYNPF